MSSNTVAEFAAELNKPTSLLLEQLASAGVHKRAGTDPMDRESRFVMAWMSSGADSDALIAWESVPGKQYQVEYSNDPLTAEPVYENVSAVITASSPITEVTVPGGFLNEEGHYRVRLVED